MLACVTDRACAGCKREVGIAWNAAVLCTNCILPDAAIVLLFSEFSAVCCTLSLYSMLNNIMQRAIHLKSVSPCIFRLAASSTYSTRMLSDKADNADKDVE